MAHIKTTTTEISEDITDAVNFIKSKGDASVTLNYDPRDYEDLREFLVKTGFTQYGNEFVAGSLLVKFS